jgi:aminoglycoside phosphotransferase
VIPVIEKLLREVPLSVFPGRRGPYHFIVRDGGSGPADTRQAFVFTPRSKLPALVVKAARERPGAELLKREHKNLTWLQGAPDESFRASVPRPVFLKERQGHTFLAETVLPGRRVKELEPGEFLALDRLNLAVDWLAEFARFGGHRRAADPGLVNRYVEGVASRYLESFEVGEDEWELLQRLGSEAERAAGPRQVLLAPCHGDFCDANLLWDGQALGVIDWDAEVEPELPYPDLFYLLLSLVATPARLGSAEAMRAAFEDAFLPEGSAFGPVKQAVTRYGQAIGAGPDWARVAFVVSWCRFALGKLAYLEITGGRSREGEAAGGEARQWLSQFPDPNRHLPLLHFQGASCLNVRLACQYWTRLDFSGSSGD